MRMHNPNLKTKSQQLRNNMTPQERKLWYEFLKDLSIQFYRQKIMGKYILDFYCPTKKIAIELDGSQHYEEEGEKSDKERDGYLNDLGITVLRYTNLEINKNFKTVCEDIYKNLNLE